MSLSPDAQEVLRKIQIIREQLPECESTSNAEAKLLRKLKLEEIAEVALALKQWEASND